MENHWVGRYRNRQLKKVEEFLHQMFTEILVTHRPHPNGHKLFIKQMRLHIGNIVRVRNSWEIQYYDNEGGYSQEDLGIFDETEFWSKIETHFKSGMNRSAIKK